jgi:outer membrane protein
MMMTRTPFQIAAFVLCVAAAHAEERPAIPARLTLQEAMRIAFQQSTTLRTAAARLSEAQARADQARASLLPQLSLNAYQSELTNNLRALGLDVPFLPTKVGPFPVVDARVFATQDIVNFASWGRRKASRERVATVEEQGRNVRESLALAVASAYLQALRVQNTVATLTEQVGLAEKLAGTTRDRTQAGVASRLDLNRAEQQVNNLRQNLEEARQALTAAKVQLTYVIHARVSAEFDLEPVTERSPALDAAESVRSAKAARADFRAAQSQLRAAELQRNSVKATRLPTFQAQGNWGQSGRTPADNISTFNVRGVVSMPLFTGGRIAAEMKEAEGQVDEAKASLDDVEAQVEADVLTAVAAVASARRQVQVSEQNLKLARQELDLANDRYLLGVADNTEVVNAQDRIARAEDARIRALHNERVAEANLFRATGAAEKTYREQP